VLPVLQATAAALLFGLSAPLAKILVGAVSPWSLAGLLYLGAGGFLTVVRLGRRGRPDLGTAFQASDRWWLAGVVLAGGILAPPLLLWGLARAPAASIALLLNTEVIFTALIAAALFREHVGARILGATGLVALGGMAVEWSGSGPALSTAAVATLVACGLWGLDNNLTRRIAEADPLALVQVKGLAAGTTNLILASLVGSPRPGLASVALGLRRRELRRQPGAVRPGPARARGGARGGLLRARPVPWRRRRRPGRGDPRCVR
jgi:drug/metabolite transporter (DMT)-like permease